MQKNYFSFPNSFTNILLEIRSSIINQVWIGLVIFILPITLYDIYLFWDGFNIQFFYKLIQAVIIIVISIWRNSFNISFKVGVFLTLLYFLIVSGFYRFGFYSSAGIFIVVFVAIAFLFLRFKLFVLTVLIISFSYIFLASLFVKGVITLDYTRAYFSYSHLNWIVDLLIIIFISYVSVFSMFKFFNAYKIELMNHINTEEKIKHTLEYLPVPVATFNKNREITMINKEYEKYFGYSIVETPTIEDWMIKLYPDADERNRVWKEILNEVKSFEVFRENIIEYEITTKYNGKKNVRAHYTLTEDVVICTLIDQTERIKKRQEIIESIITTEKKEKERIGRELHDGLGPLLTTAKIYVHSLNDEKEVNEEYLSRLNQLLNDALHELRMLINNESPHILKQYGLEKAIQTFLQNINSVSGIKVHLESSALEFNKEIIEFALYRAILELINNTLKYSKASQISISIKQMDDNVTVTYLDNGIGFDYFEGIKKGNGLNNIHNRIDNVGGKVIFETEPGRGVKVVIQMNVNKDL